MRTISMCNGEPIGKRYANIKNPPPFMKIAVLIVAGKAWSRLVETAVLVLLFSGLEARGAVLHAELTQTGSTFTYTLFNDEPGSSPYYVNAFHLVLNAPVTVTATPSAWSYETDNVSYIDWFNIDANLPYLHDIAPQSSLGGFTLESTVTTSQMANYAITTWDHDLDDAGPSAYGSVPTPALTSVPELPVCACLATIILTVVAFWHGQPKVGRQGSLPEELNA